MAEHDFTCFGPMAMWLDPIFRNRPLVDAPPGRIAKKIWRRFRNHAEPPVVHRQDLRRSFASVGAASGDSHGTIGEPANSASGSAGSGTAFNEYLASGYRVVQGSLWVGDDPPRGGGQYQ